MHVLSSALHFCVVLSAQRVRAAVASCDNFNAKIKHRRPESLPGRSSLQRGSGLSAIMHGIILLCCGTNNNSSSYHPSVSRAILNTAFTNSVSYNQVDHIVVPPAHWWLPISSQN